MKNQKENKEKVVKFDSKVKADYASKVLYGGKKRGKNKTAYTSKETIEKEQRKKGKKRKIKKVEKFNGIKVGGEDKKQQGILIAKREEGEKKTPLRKLKDIVSYGFICILACILGFLAGNMYVEANFSASYDFDEASFRYTETELNSIIASNKNVATTNALYALIIAEEKMKSIDYIAETPENSSYTSPDIAPTQKIYAYRKKSGNNYEYLTVTEGIMSIAERVITKDNGENYDIWRTKTLDNGKPVFSTDPSYKMTNAEAKAEYGTDMTNPVAYVVSNKTIHSSYNSDASLTGLGSKNANGNYNFSLKLNTTESVMNYVKQMKHMSELKNYPVFFNITFNFELDSEFRFVSIHIVENYKVSYFGVPANCNAELKLNFTY